MLFKEDQRPSESEAGSAEFSLEITQIRNNDVLIQMNN